MLPPWTPLAAANARREPAPSGQNPPRRRQHAQNWRICNPTATYQAPTLTAQSRRYGSRRPMTIVTHLSEGSCALDVPKPAFRWFLSGWLAGLRDRPSLAGVAGVSPGRAMIVAHWTRGRTFARVIVPGFGGPWSMASRTGGTTPGPWDVPPSVATERGTGMGSSFPCQVRAGRRWRRAPTGPPCGLSAGPAWRVRRAARAAAVAPRCPVDRRTRPARACHSPRSGRRW
jgi:hypothetical protein